MDPSKNVIVMSYAPVSRAEAPNPNVQGPRCLHASRGNVCSGVGFSGICLGLRGRPSWKRRHKRRILPGWRRVLLFQKELDVSVEEADVRGEFSKIGLGSLGNLLNLVFKVFNALSLFLNAGGIALD